MMPKTLPLLALLLFGACPLEDDDMAALGDETGQAMDGCDVPGDYVSIEWTPGLCAECLCGGAYVVVECGLLMECGTVGKMSRR